MIDNSSATRALSALIPNYGHVLAVMFYYHRDTEDTEDIFLFAHRETAMGKKPVPSAVLALLNKTKILFMLQH